MENLTIRWGNYYTKAKVIDGHMLDANGTIFIIHKSRTFPDYQKEEIGDLSGEKFCRLLKLIRKRLLETQALNVPADSSKFVEYSNPATNTNMRAVWNPRYKTPGSKGFREVYDSLQAVIRSINE